MTGFEEFEEGMCKGGTDSEGLGATTGLCNPVGGGTEDEDGTWGWVINPVGGGTDEGGGGTEAAGGGTILSTYL